LVGVKRKGQRVLVKVLETLSFYIGSLGVVLLTLLLLLRCARRPGTAKRQRQGRQRPRNHVGKGRPH